jgi:hypothetical protein
VATKTACPFCFSEIDSSNLGFLCSGQGNVPCKKPDKGDPERIKLTGNTALSYRYLPPDKKGKDVARCDECHGETRRRACPECHTALPVDFVGTRTPMMGLVGSKGSGKTVLMTVLVQQLRSVIGRRFGADISIATDNPDGMQSIGAYMKGREKALYNDGRLPDGTFTLAQRGFATPIVLRWRAKKSTMLAFLDSAGEDFQDDETAQSLRYLTACEYLIVALDPFSLPGARARINLPKEAHDEDDIPDDDSIYALRRVTNRLRTQLGITGGSKKKISMPVAIVFTKIDAFFPGLEEGNQIMATAPATPVPAYNETDGATVHELMKTLIAEWDAHEIDSLMTQNYDNYRYFGVSALGAQPDYARAQVAKGGVQPHRVEDPVLWLMSKAGTIKAVKTA